MASVYDIQVDSGPLAFLQVAAMQPYSHVVDLLKAMPAGSGPPRTQADQNRQKAGDDFKAMLQNDGMGIDSSVAQPLDDALNPEKNPDAARLQSRVVQLWKEHPEVLDKVIAEIRQNPHQNAVNDAAIFDQAYAAEYPTVAVASAPAAHTPPKTAAAPKPKTPVTTASKPASSTPATAAVTSGETASSAPSAAPIATAVATGASVTSSPADSDADTSTETVDSAKAGGPAAGLAGIFSGGGLVALIANLIPFIMNLFKALTSGGGFGSLLKGFGLSGGSSSGSSGGGLMSGIMSFFGNLSGGPSAQPSSTPASVATANDTTTTIDNSTPSGRLIIKTINVLSGHDTPTPNATADGPQPPVTTASMDNYHANQPNVASLKNTTPAASDASSPDSGTTTKPDAANINDYHASHADLSSLKVATGAPLVASAPGAQATPKAKPDGKAAPSKLGMSPEPAAPV